MMSFPEIIKAGLSDAQTISELGRKTFYDTWIHENNEKDMQRYLEEAFSVKSIESQLRDTDSFFYLMKLEGEYAGYLKLNIGDAQTEFQETNALEIEKIYFLKEFMGKKLANYFIEKSFSIARDLKKKKIWLGVSERNPRALAFYKRYEFKKTGEHVFMIGNTPDTDLIMEKHM